MACLWKHPNSKNWFARFVNALGVQVNRSTKSPDRRTAQVVADSWEHAERLARQGTLTADRARAILSETLERVTKGEESIRTVAANAFFADWLDHKVATKSESTAERYRSTVTQFLAFLGERASRPLTAIRSADVQAFLDGRGKIRSTKTVSVDAKSLSAGFAYARRQGLISRNPVDSVELPKVQSHERTGFTPEQVRILVESAEGDWKTAVLLGYFVGARLSDITNLAWRDVDLVAGSITYRQRKTSEKVTAPLHAELRAHLESIAGDSAGAIMPSLAGRETGGRNGLSATFNGIMRKAGIAQDRVAQKSGRSFSPLTFHSLRHGFESILANAEVSAELRRELTGRADDATQRGYTHLQVETQRRAIDKLPGVLGKGAV